MLIMQGELVPQLPAAESQAPGESEPPEEVMERLAHLEQLVVQLKELIRDKDSQLVQKDTELANRDTQFKVNSLCVAPFVWSRHANVCCDSTAFFLLYFYLQNEKEEFEARFTKLKLQAKAKMASLNKQIADLKGQEERTVSLTGVTTQLKLLGVFLTLSSVLSAAESRQLLHSSRRCG